MTKVAGRVAVLGWVCVVAGCGPGVVCGDGVLGGGETCDDGNEVPGDGCWLCRAEPGWRCDGDSACDPICNDGRTVEAEVCDPTDTRWAGYCSADCMMITGSCGDTIIQSSEECDDGMPGGGDGCTDACREALGWTCMPSGTCDASSVDPGIVIGDLDGADLTAFCTWMIESLGGTGRVHRCGAVDFTVNPVATCETAIRDITGPTAACTVGQWEAWTGERSSECDYFQSTTPICP